MKNNRLSFAITAMAIAAVISAAVISCKKEQQYNPSGEEQEIENNQDGQEAVARILDFKKKIAYHESHPGVKTGDTLTVDEAIWDIEALFNYTYAYPELFYGNMVTADTTLYLPLVSDTTVLLSDLTVFYGQMCEAISDIYHSIDLPNKQFVILDADDSERVDLQQAVVLHCVLGSVREAQPPMPQPIQWGPFTDTIDWCYGKKGGRRDGYLQHEKDATYLLTDALNNILVPHAPAGQEYVYTGILMKNLQNGYHAPFSYTYNSYHGEYCEFYFENPEESDKWLSKDQLNFHYYGERHLVLNVLPDYVDGGQAQVPSGHSLFKILIIDYDIQQNEDLSVIGHHTEAYYGLRSVVYHNSVVKGNL